VLESECIDRMYLNVYVPQLQRVGGVVWYLHGHLGQRFASTASVAPKTAAFVTSIEKFVAEQGVDLVSFGKHQRKNDVTRQYLQQFDAAEGVLYVGRAQEKAGVVRTERRRCARTGMSYPWVVDDSPMVNHYYVYCVDGDFGPFFLTFSLYFPYNAKLCINGNEYAKCQLRKRGSSAIRRMLEIEQISHDCALGEAAFQDPQRARHVDGQRAAALRVADPKAQALLHALVMFVFVARGLSNQDLRQAYAVLLGLRPGDIGLGRMSYGLRHLRLHGLIERVTKTHRYRLTNLGLQTALFYTCVYSRILRSGLPLVSPQAPAASPASLQRSFRSAEQAVNTWCDQVKIAA
jgi:hypothetical protein